MNRRTLRTARLEIAYLQAGPEDGPPVLLLHGFPDDATAWEPVIKKLASEGRRAIAPFIRGCAGTRFLSGETPRAGDFAALGQDALDFVDTLDLKDLVVVGQDWGSPAAEVVAIERPERTRRLIKLNWYGVYSMAELAKAQGFSYPQLRTLWYVWLLNLPLGEMALQYDRAGFARALWKEWSPTWEPVARDKAFDDVVSSFEGDDWMRVALAAYRNGSSAAELDPADEQLRGRLKDPPPVRCETIIMTGAADGVERSPLDEKAIARYFHGGAKVEVLPEIGHFPQREAPDAVARAILG